MSRKCRIFVFLALPVLLIYLCSCASAVKKRPLSVYLTNNAQYILLPPGGIEQPVDMAQFISASFQGQEYYINAWVRADETGMEMIMFNELGAAMGELTYREGLIGFSSAVFPNSLKPEYIVADFQLCFYNPLQLQQSLSRIGLVFEIVENFNITIRRILKGEDVIIEIEKEPNAVRLTNYLRGYKYTLEGEFK